MFCPALAAQDADRQMEPGLAGTRGIRFPVARPYGSTTIRPVMFGW
jgi:hypothetical protein